MERRFYRFPACSASPIHAGVPSSFEFLLLKQLRVEYGSSGLFMFFAGSSVWDSNMAAAVQLIC